jgi:hypothetical protein
MAFSRSDISILLKVENVLSNRGGDSIDAQKSSLLYDYPDTEGVQMGSTTLVEQTMIG